MKQIKPLFESYFRSWRANPMTQLTTLFVLSLSFGIVLTLTNITINLERILSMWGDTAELTVYLEDEIEESSVAKIKEDLGKLEGFSDPELITKEKAYREFSAQMAQYAPEILSDENYESILPQSFRLTLNSKSDLGILSSAAKKIQNWLGVEDVSYGQQWVERYGAILSGFRQSGWMINLTIFLSVLFIVGNSIRTTISQRREEIEVLELVGATASVIRRPFIFEGALTGFISSIVALSINFGFVVAQKVMAREVFLFWDLSSEIRQIGIVPSIAFVVICTSVGAIGSYICVRQINTGWAASRRVGG